MTNNAFKNDQITKQKKLYGYKLVAMAWNFSETRISNFKCFLTTFWTVELSQKQLQKKRLQIWIWISNFCSTSSLGHGLSGTVLTLLWNPAVATQSGWACSQIPTMAGCSVGTYLLVPMYQISPNSPLSDHLWPGSLVFFVQELVLDGMGLAQTARSTLPPTMVVTDSKQ